jgi:hypothetical protein
VPFEMQFSSVQVPSIFNRAELLKLEFWGRILDIWITLCIPCTRDAFTTAALCQNLGVGYRAVMYTAS